MPFDVLVARAAEALQQERFKEAVELFKQLIRQDPRPEWKHSLAEAYQGRARALAAKRMFKEAAMVLENTQASDGRVRDPLFYLQCLVRDGQLQKAATHAILYIDRNSTLPDDARAALEELTAALLVTMSLRPDAARPSSAEHTRWLDLAAASRNALDAWVNGAPVDEIERHLGQISLRSAFRPVRLLLKSLLGGPQDADRLRRLLDAIAPGSPFSSFREAVEAVLSGELGVNADIWHRLTPVQQAFVAEVCGLPATASQFAARLAEAMRGGPAALFTFLLKQNDLLQAERRSACLNLLPQVIDRLPQFEKSFGPLSAFERHRIQALAAEARGDWSNVEWAWRGAVESIPAGNPQAGLMRGVIFRHLADLAAKYPQIAGDPNGLFTNPVIDYLEYSHEADPDYVPTMLELIGHYRNDGRVKDWHRLVEAAVQRFPDNGAVLQQATDAAVARKAYKKAAGFARRLLQIDPINSSVRRQMIELQVAHARKQLRSKRSDLALKDLVTAAEWERPDAPSALLRIAHGLTELQTGKREAAEARLRQGVDLVGGGAAGWFRAVLEAELMRIDSKHTDWMRKELAQARMAPPTRDAVMAVVSALSQPEVAEIKKAVASLLLGMRSWLQQAASFDWSPTEFQALAEKFAGFDAFDLLQDYAQAGHRRDPTNPTWRFHQIVGRTRSNAARLSGAETDELEAMIGVAASRQDFHTANRIERFLDGEPVTGSSRRRRLPDLPNDFEDAAIQMLIETMLNQLPKGASDSLRALVKDIGQEAAVAMMAEQFRDLSLESGMPEATLREMCEAMVARAVAGAGPQRDGTARRSRA